MKYIVIIFLTTFFSSGIFAEPIKPFGIELGKPLDANKYPDIKFGFNEINPPIKNIYFDTYKVNFTPITKTVVTVFAYRDWRLPCEELFTSLALTIIRKYDLEIEKSDFEKGFWTVLKKDDLKVEVYCKPETFSANITYSLLSEELLNQNHLELLEYNKNYEDKHFVELDVSGL